jgi:predicted nucleic acid-binding protein
MAERKRLVLDANILIRGCLGVRVRALIAYSAREVDFFVAEANSSEASGYLSELAARRGLDPQICQEAFLSLMEVVQIVDSTWIETARDEALKRIRDPADWPALALALQLECAIWTEDQDFFGTGVATWTTATVHRYLDC